MQFRKKPVVIEAFQMTRECRSDNRDWPEWLNRAWNLTWPEVGAVSCEDYPSSKGTDRLVISTLEGVMTVGWDDWIIRGVAGELYPCKPDIFAATYETASKTDHDQANDTAALNLMEFCLQAQANELSAYRNGNTKLLETVMNLVWQFIPRGEEPDTVIHHFNVGAEEGAIQVLIDAGMIEEVEIGKDAYRLLWARLAARKQPIAWADAVEMHVTDPDERQRLLALDEPPAASCADSGILDGTKVPSAAELQRPDRMLNLPEGAHAALAPKAEGPKQESECPRVGDRKPWVVDPSSGWPVYTQADIDRLAASTKPGE